MGKHERVSLSNKINDEAIEKINCIKASNIDEDEKLKKIDLILAISGGQMYKVLFDEGE